MRRTRLAIAATVVAAGAFGTQYALGTSHADAISSQVHHLVASATGHPSVTADPTSPAARATATTTPASTTPATSTPASTRSALRLARGATGGDVTVLQQRLVRLGLLSAQPNGFYGPATASAVARFQSGHSLPQVGGVDQATWDAIAAAASAVTVPSSPTSSQTPTTSPTSTSSTAPSTNHRAPASTGLDPRCLTGRVMCVDKDTLRLSWVVDGQVQDSWSIRVGMAAHPTREGEFSVYRMERNSWSNLYHVNMPYAMYFSGGEAVHYSAQFANTGYGDGSHGCVNLRDYNGIAWLYSQVQVGDKVVVYS